jgi:thiamine transport system permease protein
MPGWIAFASLVGIVVLALSGLVAKAPVFEFAQLLADGEIPRIVRYTLWQAGLSTLISIMLAIPFARALARRRNFWGRGLLIRLSSISLVIPTMVAVFGIAAVHGRNGWLNQALATIMGVENPYSVYGLNGILIAHVFFNLPLATRVFLNAIESLPGETWRLTRQLGFTPITIFKLIEWPLLRAVIPGIAGLIFILCFTSFAIVLALGGGPKWSTLEVAIYQAIRFDFDIARGVVLAFIQIGICLILVLLFASTRRGFSFQPTHYTPGIRPDVDHAGARVIDTLVILLIAGFLLSPLVAVLFKAMTPVLLQVLSSPAFTQAMLSSLIISLCAGMLSLLLSLPIAFLYKNLKYKNAGKRIALLDVGSTLILVVPPLTLGMGLFLVLRAYSNLFEFGIYLVILVNGMLAVPFLIRILQPAIHASAQQVDRLSASLGIRGWALFHLIYWPQIRNSIGFAFALAATLSLGDMGVIALFGTQDLSTLPLLIYRLFGAYRMDEAAVVAMALCLMCFAIFWGIEYVIGGPNRAQS